jgi:hypothetical protein
MNVNSSDNEQWWRNVEMTGYAKVISAASNDAEQQVEGVSQY